MFADVTFRQGEGLQEGEGGLEAFFTAVGQGRLVADSEAVLAVEDFYADGEEFARDAEDAEAFERRTPSIWVRLDVDGPVADEDVAED